MRIAIFPGSFDPFTIGHADIVRRALPLFDEIIIGVGINSQKQPLFPLDERIERIQKAFAGEQKVKVLPFDSLTVDFAREHGAQFLLRGIRTTIDFEYERTMADTNRQLADNQPTVEEHKSNEALETVVLFTRPELAHISSSLVRDLASHGKDITPYIV